MNKVSGGDGHPGDLIQILKMMLLKCYSKYATTLEDSAVATGLEKVGFHSSSKERQCQIMFKPPHNCAHFTC